MEASLFDFFREVMLPRDLERRLRVPRRPARRLSAADADEARERLRFAMKFQQYTGPVQAKGLEDTAFYRYNVAAVTQRSRRRSGSRFGRSVAEFHDANAKRLRSGRSRCWRPRRTTPSLVKTCARESTSLSELPHEWAREAAQVDAHARRPTGRIVDGEAGAGSQRRVPLLPGADRRMAGARWRPTRPRRPRTSSSAAALHAQGREGSQDSYELADANEPYENALNPFIQHVLSGRGAGRFLPAMLPFQRRIAVVGMVNSLAQTGLKLGSPGVPDFYQGTELWDLSLVDPDNRRPVDFAQRQRLLDEVDACCRRSRRNGRGAVRVAASWEDGRIKLLTVAAGLRLRRNDPSLFLDGSIHAARDGHHDIGWGRGICARSR